MFSNFILAKFLRLYYLYENDFYLIFLRIEHTHTYLGADPPPIDESPAMVIDIEDPDAIVILGMASVLFLDISSFSSSSSPQ